MQSYPDMQSRDEVQLILLTSPGPSECALSGHLGSGQVFSLAPTLPASDHAFPGFDIDSPFWESVSDDVLNVSMELVKPPSQRRKKWHNLNTSICSSIVKLRFTKAKRLVKTSAKGRSFFGQNRLVSCRQAIKTFTSTCNCGNHIPFSTDALAERGSRKGSIVLKTHG